MPFLAMEKYSLLKNLAMNFDVLATEFFVTKTLIFCSVINNQQCLLSLKKKYRELTKRKEKVKIIIRVKSNKN